MSDAVVKALAQAEVNAACERVRDASAEAFSGVLSASAFRVGQLAAYLEVDRAAGRLFEAAIVRSGPFDPNAAVALIRLNIMKGMTEPSAPGLTGATLKHLHDREIADAEPLEPVPSVEPEPEPEVTAPVFSGFGTKLRQRIVKRPPAD